MDIRIEQTDGDPPTWKVFLGTFFIVCTSEDEACVCAEAAHRYASANPAIHCDLPSPPAAVTPLRAGCCPPSGAELEAWELRWPERYLGT
ncbi:hypothetical protein [Pseudomonas sp. 273]|uniref:hypothetical protein n=1 Tax=Pseudomonas sp. 273 TaxID=75692 RepID=UPI0023D8AFA0|nr:hypothetical protein [Pseudomonas sp. 273]